LQQKGQNYSGDLGKMMAATPDYVVFNGMVNQYREQPLLANPGELVRLYVVNAGPNLQSDFHVIGTIFSAVYPDGNPNNRLTGVQTYNIPPGGGATFELTIPNAGTYPFVTHSFAAASKGALGVLQVGQPVAGAPAHDMTVPSEPSGAPKINLMADNNRFDQKTLTTKAGEAVTLNLMNHDAAVHNLHIVGLKGSDGKEVQTALLEQGKSASVTFSTAKPGSYKFVCDVHPADMTGTLLVK
jgi:plastocyanin